MLLLYKKPEGILSWLNYFSLYKVESKSKTILKMKISEDLLALVFAKLKIYSFFLSFKYSANGQ